MTSNITIKRNACQQRGMCLHASAVNISGKALLFLGHSTAGKSTISRLLSECYPVIADDKVLILKKRNGCWLVRDNSDNIRAGNNTNSMLSHDQYPLLAILRIFKSKTTRIEPISQRKTCKYLMDAVFEIDFQRKVDDLLVKKKWFSYAGDISKKNVGWELTFSIDTNIIKYIHDIFKRKKLENSNLQQITRKR